MSIHFYRSYAVLIHRSCSGCLKVRYARTLRQQHNNSRVSYFASYSTFLSQRVQHKDSYYYCLLEFILHLNKGEAKFCKFCSELMRICDAPKDLCPRQIYNSHVIVLYTNNTRYLFFSTTNHFYTSAFSSYCLTINRFLRCTLEIHYVKTLEGNKN